MLAKLGSRLFKRLGDSDYGQKSYCHHDLAYTQLANFFKFSDFLPYRSFDEETQLFINQDAMGFVIETSPLVGCSEEMQKEISNLFQQLLPEESSLQVMLWADPHIDGFCEAYAAARQNQSDILRALAARRSHFLKSLAFDSPYAPYSLRTFRCLLSLTQKLGSSSLRQKDDLVRLKQQLMTTLEMVGLSASVWEPGQLLNTLSSLLTLNPDKALQDKNPQKTQLRWNKLQALNEQMGSAESHIQVDQEGLSLNDHKIAVRTYNVRQYPEVWSLHAMGELIGDKDRDQAQIPCPFIIHYGIYIPKQDKLKTGVLAKSTYRSNPMNVR